MKFIDFFAGIGGFHSGLEKAGMECIGWCEFDKFAQKSYRAMYDTERLWFADDVRKVRGWDVPKADLWTFGFPCQDVSLSLSKKELNEEQGLGSFMKLCVSSTKRKKIDPNGLYVKMLKICYLLTEDEDSLKFSLKWGGEGTLLNGKFTTAKITEFRKTENESTLLDIMETHLDSHYYLSEEQTRQLLERL